MVDTLPTTRTKRTKFIRSYNSVDLTTENTSSVTTYYFLLFAISKHSIEKSEEFFAEFLRDDAARISRFMDKIIEEDLDPLSLRISKGHLSDAGLLFRFLDIFTDAVRNVASQSTSFEHLIPDFPRPYFDNVFAKCDILFSSVLNSIASYYKYDSMLIKRIAFALPSSQLIGNFYDFSSDKTPFAFFHFSGCVNLLQFIMDDNNTKAVITPELIVFIKSFDEFPGARKLGVPFKEAVELYLSIRYSDALRAGTLTRPQIYAADKKLYRAIADYEKVAELPFDIPSVRDVARDRFQYFVEHGLEGASRAARLSINKMTKRLQKPTP